MAGQEIAAALERVESALRRRPAAGLHDDAPAVALWQQGTRVVTGHAAGTRVATDMPAELGGSGDQPTPGWLFRAGLASCAATSIALKAAAQGIELDRLEVRAGSRSDARGLLGMADEDGAPVEAGPLEVQLHVRLAAAGVAAPVLRDMVDAALRCSPVPSVVRNGTALVVQVDPGPPHATRAPG